MKSLKINLFLTVALSLSVVLFSCSKKDDPAPAGEAHKGVLKVSVSSGSSISNVIYGTEKGTVSATGLSGTSYTSPEFDIPAGTVTFVGGGAGTGKDVNATMKAELYIDGELKKEASGSGTALNVTAQYLF